METITKSRSGMRTLRKVKLFFSILSEIATLTLIASAVYLMRLLINGQLQWLIDAIENR